jgi:hypothetical protein
MAAYDLSLAGPENDKERKKETDGRGYRSLKPR